MKCKSCGADLVIDPENQSAERPYCGSRLILEAGTAMADSEAVRQEKIRAKEEKKRAKRQYKIEKKKAKEERRIREEKDRRKLLITAGAVILGLVLLAVILKAALL